jgi:predicted NUDIX family NTP pyrophosphohydrolase
VLVWRPGAGGPHFLLVHPGGPFWQGRDLAAWSIPKGLVDPDEDGWAAAAREFAEELGQAVDGPGEPLTPRRTPGGKWIHAWLVRAEFDLTDLRSNRFELEWPKGSGRMQSFPEVDRAAYFPAIDALKKIHKGQRPILEEALARLSA